MLPDSVGRPSVRRGHHPREVPPVQQRALRRVYHRRPAFTYPGLRLPPRAFSKPPGVFPFLLEDGAEHEPLLDELALRLLDARAEPGDLRLRRGHTPGGARAPADGPARAHAVPAPRGGGAPVASDERERRWDAVDAGHRRVRRGRCAASDAAEASER